MIFSCPLLLLDLEPSRNNALNLIERAGGAFSESSYHVRLLLQIAVDISPLNHNHKRYQNNLIRNQNSRRARR